MIEHNLANYNAGAPRLAWYRVPMKSNTPEPLRKLLVKAGRKRAALMTSEERSANARKAWQTRLAKAREKEAANAQ